MTQFLIKDLQILNRNSIFRSKISMKLSNCQYENDFRHEIAQFLQFEASYCVIFYQNHVKIKDILFISFQNRNSGKQHVC